MFQRITGSTLGLDLRMFGQSLSSGIDIDDNGYQGNRKLLDRMLYTLLYLSCFKEGTLCFLQMWQLVRSCLIQLWFSGKSQVTFGLFQHQFTATVIT